MLPQKNRLKKTKDFENVWHKGKIARESFLLLKFAKNNLDESRFGFAVGMKVSKKAVVRNKIKRWLREAIRTNLTNIKPGIDIIISAIPGTEKSNFAEIKEKTNKLLKKSELI